MKRKLGIVFGILIVVLGGAYLSKNYIIEKVLEDKLTEINKGKVDIGKVDFSPFEKRIVIEDIDFTSRKDGMKNFISIGKFETDYDIYIEEKKVLVSKAKFDGVRFMTPRETNGNTGYVVEEPNEVKINTEGNLEESKDSTVQDLEELIQARALVNKMALQNMLKSQYEKVEGIIKERQEYWNDKLEALEKTPEYMILKENYNKIANEKNPLKIIRMEKEIKKMLTSFKILSKELLKDREEMKRDFNTIVDIGDMDRNLEQAVNELVTRGEFVITDLDSIVNYYLNEIYGSEIEKMVVKYRNLMRELELRRDEDAKAQEKWEIFAEEICINSKLYGIELKGGIKNISSRLSRNKTDIGLYLTADSSISHGEAYGYVDLSKLQGKVNINISNFNFEDLRDMEMLNKYVKSGEAALVKEILLSRDNIDISGDVEIQDMSLDEEEVVNKLNLQAPLLKNMITPLLKELNSGNVHYGYNSVDGKLVIKSDLSEEMMNILNDDNGIMKKKIIEDMLREGREELNNYKNNVDEDNKVILEELEGKLDEKSKYLDKVQEVLDKFNLGGILENF